jgi:Methyl-accepting chemotaxis protein
VGYRTAMANDIETLNGVIGQLLDDQAVLVAKDSHFARTLQIATTLLALLIGALAAVIIARQISQPLHQALKAMEQVAAGDLSEQPTSRRRDEVGQLQNALQGMTRNLRELIAQVRDGISQIASATEELSAITEQTSAGANNQKVETDQVATAMQEMAPPCTKSRAMPAKPLQPPAPLMKKPVRVTAWSAAPWLRSAAWPARWTPLVKPWARCAARASVSARSWT